MSGLDDSVLLLPMESQFEAGEMRKVRAIFSGISDSRSFRRRQFLVAALFIILVNSLPHFAILSAYAQPEGSDPGYLDSAFISTRIRLRFDAGWDLNRPDRAEFFYGTWANMADHQHAIKDTHQLLTAVNNRGPFIIGESVNFQEISAYLEFAYTDRASVFAELPIRFVQFIGDGEDPRAFTTPEFRATYEASPTKTNGVGDTIFGFKFAMLNDPNAVLTFQLRTFVPTGDSRSGLGTGHVSVEPGLLLQTRLSDNISFMAQAKLWSPIDGGANAGNIAIYGAGLGINLYGELDGRPGLRFTPLAEFVGWTIMDGFETLSSPAGAAVVPNSARVIGNPNNINQLNPPQNQAAGILPAPTSHGVQIATGETIVNAKLGVRTHFGPRDSLYIGWGRALTGDRWYKDFGRIEFQRVY